MDPVIPPVQSAQLPIMEPDVVDLIQMIDEGKSCNSIFRQLCNSSLVANAATADLDTHINRALFHSLPLPLMRSLLMGTLGSHFYSKDAMRDNWNAYLYDDDYAGAYVAFLHIHHRKGAFLSQRETRQLIQALGKYSAGVRLYEDYYTEGYRAFGTADREALEFTQVIDDELREVAYWDPSVLDSFHHMERPSFAESETREIGTASVANSNINALIRMFESRCTIDGSDPTNTDLDVFQLQSPMMVGNTGYLRGRMVNHLPDDYGSGVGTSKVYALTMSCLKHMGLEAKSTVFPILLAWKEDQIDPSEVLGTVLANSRLPGHGYNVKMPGTRGSRTPNPRLEQAKEYVFYWKPFLKDNLQQSVDELGEDAVAEERAALTRELAHAHEAIDGVKDALDELQKLKIEYEQVNAEWKEAIEATKAHTEDMKRACAEYDKLVEEDEDFLEMLRGN